MKLHTKSKSTEPACIVHLVCAVGSLILLSGCPSGEGETPDGGRDGGNATEQWSEAFPLDDNISLSSVWGSDPENVFVVGGNDASGVVYFYDGDSWSKMDNLPDVGLLAWVYGFAADDVYAAGWEGTIVHYDGNTWSTIESGTSEPFWGVWGTSGNDLYFVGGEVNFNPPLLIHYDGNSMEPVSIGNDINPTDANSLFKVWGIEDRVFAVGQDGLILGRTGQGEWTRFDAGPDAVEDFVALWGTSATNIVAVGGRSGAQISTFDGVSWTTSLPLGVDGLSAVTMLSSETALIGGVAGLAATFDVATGEISIEESSTRFDIHASWVGTDGVAYAVAGTFATGLHNGAALVRQGDGS